MLLRYISLISCCCLSGCWTRPAEIIQELPSPGGDHTVSLWADRPGGTFDSRMWVKVTPGKPNNSNAGIRVTISSCKRLTLKWLGNDLLRVGYDDIDIGVFDKEDEFNPQSPVILLVDDQFRASDPETSSGELRVEDCGEFL